ncbi:MAG: T9SS type A sorting domain-containing protein, partial [Flavitalea sp.]
NAAAPWNNIFASPTIEATFPGLVNQAGAASGLSLVLTKIFNGEFTAGMVTGNNSGPVPDAVLAGDFWLDNTQLSEFKVTGLNHSKRYRFGFFGSSGPNGWYKGNYTATYTINGRTVYLNSWLNASKVVYISDVVPDENGEVTLDFSTVAAANYGFNGGILIEDYTDVQGGTNNNLVLDTTGMYSMLTPSQANKAKAAALAVSTNGRMYPNPCTDFINIDFNNSAENNRISADIYDLSGRLSYHKEYGNLPAGNNTLRISTSESAMTTGVYMVTLNVNGKVVQANKVIKTKN